jgi:chromosome segregation ATPase
MSKEVDFTKKIADLQKLLKELNDAKVKAETQLEATEKTLSELRAKMAELDVTPENIEAKILELETSITTDLEAVEKQIKVITDKLESFENE